MGVGEIERELALLRLNDDGTSGARQSVLNLIVPVGEDAAPEVTRVISELASRYPSRAIVLIADPDEPEPRLEVGLSAFCSIRGGTGGQVCAEVVTVHAEGPPATHPESFAGPLLVPDLPAFLWYPDGRVPAPSETLVSLADRVVVDTGAGDDPEASLRAVAALVEAEGAPPVGDLQWTALAPWRTIVARLFDAPDGPERLRGLERVEIVHSGANDSLDRALLFVAWLSRSLGWRPEGTRRSDAGAPWELAFSTSGGGAAVVVLQPSSPDAALRRMRLFSGGVEYGVDRHHESAAARATVRRGGELLQESTVRLGHFDRGALLGDELRFTGRDEAYEAAVGRAVELLA